MADEPISWYRMSGISHPIEPNLDPDAHADGAGRHSRLSDFRSDMNTRLGDLLAEMNHRFDDVDGKLVMMAKVWDSELSRVRDDVELLKRR